MQALGLGRACKISRFCLPPPHPLLPPQRRRRHAGSKSGGVACRGGATRSAQAMEGAQQEEAATTRVVTLRAVEATPESFAPFGQVIGPSGDRDRFGPHDAQLDLTHGVPRIYIMRLEDKPLKFSSITHHASVTQCLGSIGGQDWYLAVAKPSVVDGAPEQGGADGRKPVQARAGHYYLPPDPSEVRVFLVPGHKFIKMHKGTWHAGPLFKANAMDFYNLELSNTNIIDHTSHYFKKHDGVTFVIEE